MEQMTDKQLKYEYWFVTHKLMLRGIFFVILIAANIGVWGWILFSLVKNFGIDFGAYRNWRYDLLYDRYTNIAMVEQKTQPRSIVVNDLRTLPAQNKHLDIVASVTNPNAGWVGRFQYQFAINSGVSPLREDFIMPGEQKYLFDLDVDALQVDRIVIQNVVWERFNNYPAYAALRNKFSITNALFVPPSGTDSIKAARATFTISNDSNFNYYHPRFVIRLTRLGQLVGFNTITVDSLNSNQKLDLEARWFEQVPVPDKIEVIPDIDFINPSSYLPIQ